MKGSSGCFSFWQRAKDFLYGMTTHEFQVQTAQTRIQLEDCFLLLTFGDFLGIPVFSPYYALKILPFIVPKLDGWKHRSLRERGLRF
ncbi:MAG: hypothetical protein QN198_01425 [Armatimonadota bacterium]|nr:hypothetical protein [Armatimonadota bacterium]MDR5702245.1 hypothetical protein [Armatimonadota bacterium]